MTNGNGIDQVWKSNKCEKQKRDNYYQLYTAL